MTTVYDVLVKAREVITKPEHWIKGMTCANEALIPVDITREAAYCFCSIGAIDRALYLLDGTFRLNDVLLDSAFDALAKSVKVDSIALWNDDSCRTHEEVLAAFDDAIAQTKETK